jgi:hypothetical protein
MSKKIISKKTHQEIFNNFTIIRLLFYQCLQTFLINVHGVRPGEIEYIYAIFVSATLYFLKEALIFFRISDKATGWESWSEYFERTLRYNN